MAAQEHPRPRLSEALAAWAAYAAAAWLLLYPVFARPGSEVFAPASALARPVAAWVMWILAWDVRALSDATQPLFDANIFHPANGMLALADPLLGALPWFAPVYVLTGSPVAAYQFAVLAVLSLCGAAMYALARHWGVGRAAAGVAGFIYAFCPPRIGALGEFVWLCGPFLPLALLFTDRLLARKPRVADAAALFVFAVWQVTCAIPLGWATVLALAIYLVAAAVLRRGARPWRGAALAAAALAGAVAVHYAGTAPQRELWASGLIEGRKVADFAAFSAAGPWHDYLLPPWAWRLGMSADGGALYAGGVALALALAGVWVAGRVRLPLLAVATAAWWLSLGPQVAGGWLAPYAWLAGLLSGFATDGPEPARFALLVMLAVAGLAAFGAEQLLSAARRRGAMHYRVAVAAMCAALLVDYRLPFQRFETQRIRSSADELPLDAALAELPGGPVLHLPMESCAVTDPGAVIERQLASTLHWRPLLDGHRNFDRAPVIYPVVRGLAAALPDERALHLLRRATGLRYLVVHLTELPGEWRRRWRAVPGLRRIGFFGHDLLFEVEQGDGADLVTELLALPRGRRTLTGVAAEPLPDGERAAGFTYTALPPRVAAAGYRLRAEVMVENRARVPWPALTVSDRDKVYLSYLWTDSSGGLAGGDGRAQPLPLDLAPGESVVVPVCVAVPAVAGELDLAFGLSQGERWFPDFSEKLRIRVVE